MPRLIFILPLLLIFGGVVGGGHYYIAQRLVVDASLSPGLEAVLVWGIALCAASLILQPIGERLFEPQWARMIAWPASIWMGLFFYLFLLVCFSDLLIFVVEFSDPTLLFQAGASSWFESFGPGQLRATLVLLAAGVFGALGLRGGLARPQLKRVDVRLARWPAALDGFRIAQISDIHIGPILGHTFARQLTERVNALDPDLVAITGDLVDGSVEKLATEVAPFAELRARHGVFFVTGNHDHYSGADAWVGRVRELGFTVLRNERVTIEQDGAAFELAGVDDHRAGFESGSGGEDVDVALAGLPPERAVVLLAHDPTTFKRAQGMGIDLQLSGHTHGGQIWPFRYFVRLAIPFVAGLYRRGAARLYVSCGTGFWGPPMRLFAPAEITEIRLWAAPAAGDAT
ncbi:MAG: metallophosphoesterase [Myxococcota bacterium]|nr:metallophosphoesterase [Myxococcota bacterium]